MHSNSFPWFYVYAFKPYLKFLTQSAEILEHWSLCSKTIFAVELFISLLALSSVCCQRPLTRVGDSTMKLSSAGVVSDSGPISICIGSIGFWREGCQKSIKKTKENIHTGYSSVAAWRWGPGIDFLLFHTKKGASNARVCGTVASKRWPQESCRKQKTWCIKERRGKAKKESRRIVLF